MNGPQDLGGQMGFGPIAPEKDEPIFHGEWGIGRQEMSVSAYWAHGRAEDAFQAEKREAVGKIFAD